METVGNEWMSPSDIQIGSHIAYNIFGATMLVTKVTVVPSVNAVKIDGIRNTDGDEVSWFVPESARFAI